MHTVPAKTLYLQRYSTDFRNLCLSSKMLRVGIWGKVAGAQEFYFCNGKVKTLRIDNIWNFATFNLYTVPAKKSQYLRRCWRWAFGLFNRFSKSLPLSTCQLGEQKSCVSKEPLIFASGGHWGWAFGWKVSVAQVFYFCNGKVKTLHIENIWNFATINLYTVPEKTPISSTVFNRFSKSLPQLEDVEGGHLGGKFQVRRYFTFAVARWKLRTSKTFEILPLSTCTLCQPKSYISKCIQQIFEIFASARRSWVWALGRKVAGAQVFYFFNGKVNTLRIDNIWNFATFNLYTVPAKSQYLKRYSIDFRNLGLSSKMLRVGIWVESFRCPGILLWQWQGENFAHRQNLKFCHFQPVHCAGKNPASPKAFNRFSKYLPPLEDVEGGHLCGKFQVPRYFTFAMARWKLCTSTTFEILPLSTCTLCQQKSIYLQRYSTDFRNLCLSSKMLSVGICVGSFRCAGVLLLQWQGENFAHRKHLKFCHFQPVHYAWKKRNIFNGIQPIFEIFASARRCWGWTFGRKVSVAQVFHFCNGKVENFPNIDNIWNFATFNLYNVPAKSQYLQRYSTDFRNLSLSSKMLRVGIWAESFRCARVLLLKWQGENFAHEQHLKFCHFQPGHCAGKNPISSTVFNRFSKSLPQLEDIEGGHLGGKFQVRTCFTFKMGRLKLRAWTTFEILPISTWTLCQKNPITPKVYNRFSKSLPQLEDVEGGHLGGKLQVRRYFTFAMARWKLCASNNIWNFATFILYTVPAENPMSSTVFNRFSKSLPQLEDVECGHLGRKVSGAHLFYF